MFESFISFNQIASRTMYNLGGVAVGLEPTKTVRFSLQPVATINIIKGGASPPF